MDMLYLGLFYGFKFTIWIVPNQAMFFLLKGLSLFIYKIDKKHRNIAKVNLDLAYEDSLSQKEKEKIVRLTYLNLMLLMVDFVRNQGISKEKLMEKVVFKNEEILADALMRKEKVILMTAHYGNWELISLSIAAKFGPLTAVGRKLDSLAMDKILNKNRQQFDIEMLDKKGAMKEMLNALKKNRMLGLLVDQNTSENEGVLVDFFAKPVRHTPAVAILSRRFDALIVPVFMTNNNGKNYTLTFHEPFKTEKSEDNEQDILRSVQKQAKITENIIRQKPQEWFWLHKRWKNQFEESYHS
ncbi:MAG TPA: lipid A biosynthesis acyltransferase [Epsilonproteobacteria bacterium]|nr:lipid A biosynthesis acyltransferase [Campylobacterota bacterium]